MNCSTCHAPVAPWDQPGPRWTRSLSSGQVVCQPCANKEAKQRLADFDAGRAPKWGKGVPAVQERTER